MWSLLSIIVVASAVGVGWLVLRAGRRKNIDIILLSSVTRRKEPHNGLRHVFLCFVDHFEPLWKGAGHATGLERTRMWRTRYPTVVEGLRDNGGRAPQHTFFYPQEEYVPEFLDLLGELRDRGFGDVEIHLHHDGDTSDGFRNKIESFKEVLHHRHGFLKRNQVSGLIEYGFIHGNWALDDSGAQGRWCGVKDEITILKETGCYADFTYPSAPHPTQPPITNRIYYAKDDPRRGCSHHRGIDARYGSHVEGDLLLINGPLCLNWRRRKHGLLPHLENGDITGNYPPTPDRVDLWIRSAIAVRGWPRWLFVKVHTHGVQERNADLLLGSRVRPMYEYLLSRYNDGMNFTMHFVTARELYCCVKALESADSARIRAIEEFVYEQPESGSDGAT